MHAWHCASVPLEWGAVRMASVTSLPIAGMSPGFYRVSACQAALVVKLRANRRAAECGYAIRRLRRSRLNTVGSQSASIIPSRVTQVMAVILLPSLRSCRMRPPMALHSSRPDRSSCAPPWSFSYSKSVSKETVDRSTPLKALAGLRSSGWMGELAAVIMPGTSGFGKLDRDLSRAAAVTCIPQVKSCGSGCFDFAFRRALPTKSGRTQSSILRKH